MNKAVNDAVKKLSTRTDVPETRRGATQRQGRQDWSPEGTCAIPGSTGYLPGMP